MTNSKTLNFRYLLPILIIAVSAIISYAIIAQAQTDSTSNEVTAEAEARGITFPVAELGNCGSKSECRDYCNQPQNMDACIKFAQAKGLMNKGEAERGLKYQKRILSGKTPGGCNSPESCKVVCSNISNLEACIKLADEEGLKEEKIDEARKILSYIKGGGTMPGGCTSEASCRTYCSDFNNAEECFAFAERVGLDVPEDRGPGGEKMDRDKMRKFIELAKKGETPGGCRSKEQCESYCQNESNREECITFGQKMGFMDEKKAELFRKTGGKGPGSCNSEESCKAYCNDPGHQEECFKFAEEHGLVNREDIQEAKEGFVRLRQGLEQAPPEVAECLKSNLGANIIEDIQSGNLTPGIGIGERVRGCFEKFGHRGDAKEAINQAPPEITTCVREKLGDVLEKVKSGEVSPTPEVGDAFRVCGEKLRLLQGGPGEEGREGGGPDVGRFLRSAPPGMSSCLKEKLGADFERAKQEGTPPGQEVKATLRECFESFRPETPEAREGIGPANLKDLRNFIRHEGSSTPEDFKPGLNRETFEKFRQEGVPEQYREQFREQFQGEFQKQYEEQFRGQYEQQQQQYQAPAPTEPPPTTEPAPAPEPTSTPPPTTEPQTQGNIWRALKAFFGF